MGFKNHGWLDICEVKFVNVNAKQVLASEKMTSMRKNYLRT